MSQSIPISDNHRRTIATTLALLDRMLCDFERQTQEHGMTSVLFEERQTLSNDSCQAIREQIVAMRLQLTQIRDTLALPPHVQETAQEIWSQASAFWENLVELGGKYLAAYGEPSPELVQYLDPHIEQLTNQLEHISQLAHKHKP